MASLLIGPGLARGVLCNRPSRCRQANQHRHGPMPMSQPAQFSSIDLSGLPARVPEALAGLAAVCRAALASRPCPVAFEGVERLVRESRRPTPHHRFRRGRSWQESARYAENEALRHAMAHRVGRPCSPSAPSSSPAVSTAHGHSSWARPIPRPTTATAPATPSTAPHETDQTGPPVTAMRGSRPVSMTKRYAIRAAISTLSLNGSNELSPLVWLVSRAAVGMHP